MAEELIYDLMVVLSAGLIAAVICRRLNVSVLIGYLLVGTIVGHGVLGFLDDENHHLAHLAEVGVFLLLFSIGLEFSIEDLKKLGRRFIVGGGTQMLLVAVPATIALMSLGYSWQPALLIGAAISFSSTVLVFRGLAERGHSQEPHGHRAIGILLFQDAALVPLLLMVPMLNGAATTIDGVQFAGTALTSFGFVVAVFVLRHLLATRVIPAFAAIRSAELVILFTVVALGGVTLFAYTLGLPPAVGAFAAGLIFNGNRWSHQIDALILAIPRDVRGDFLCRPWPDTGSRNHLCGATDSGDAVSCDCSENNCRRRRAQAYRAKSPDRRWDGGGTGTCRRIRIRARSDGRGQRRYQRIGLPTNSSDSCRFTDIFTGPAASWTETDKRQHKVSGIEQEVFPQSWRSHGSCRRCRSGRSSGVRRPDFQRI